MTIKLEIEFSGLCHYLIQRVSDTQPDGAIAVLMPDGRVHGRLVEPHDYKHCKKHLVPHVGYVRYNLADYLPTITGQAYNGIDAVSPFDVAELRRHKSPAFEVVHRFDFEEVFVDAAENVVGGMRDDYIYAADLSGFDPCAHIRAGLFSDTPHERLLMRMTLRGGVFMQPETKGWWSIDPTLLPAVGAPYVTELSGTATWTGTIDKEFVTLRLRSWRRCTETTIRLRPSAPDGTVRLKIANLCDRNPLEWSELYPRVFQSTADDDFKWLYFLWRDDRGPFNTVIKDQLLPVPKPHPVHGDIYNCGAGKSVVAKIGEDL